MTPQVLQVLSPIRCKGSCSGVEVPSPSLLESHIQPRELFLKCSIADPYGRHRNLSATEFCSSCKVWRLPEPEVVSCCWIAFDEYSAPRIWTVTLESRQASGSQQHRGSSSAAWYTKIFCFRFAFNLFLTNFIWCSNFFPIPIFFLL